MSGARKAVARGLIRLATLVVGDEGPFPHWDAPFIETSKENQMSVRLALILCRRALRP